MKKDGYKNTYLDHLALMHSLSNYSFPNSKITTMIKTGELIKIRRGLYLSGDSSEYCIKTIANMIFGPSYISFEYALSFYNLIPEKVQTLTSATYKKNKNRMYNTPVGAFVYKYTNPATYPYGIVRKTENENWFLIATKEKALCDTLSKVKGITTMDKLTSLLYDDMRMEEDEITSVDINSIDFFAPLYNKKILQLFQNYLKYQKKR